MGSCVVRIAGYRELIRAARLIELGAREQNVAALQVCSGALRVSLERSIVARHCLRAPPLLLERISFIDHHDRGRPRCGCRVVVDRRSRWGRASSFEISHLWSFGDGLARGAVAPAVWRHRALLIR